MRKTLYIGGIIIVGVTLSLVTLRATGFEPKDCPPGDPAWACRVPGLWLRGDVATAPVTDWSFTDQYQLIKLQTRDWLGLPHSVMTWCVASNGDLYLTSSYRDAFPRGRRWNENVTRDPHVRLKIGTQLYERTLVYVTDPDVRAAVFRDRAKKYPKSGAAGPTTHVFRVLDPRGSDAVRRP